MSRNCYIFLFYTFLSGGIIFLVFTFLSILKNKILIVEYGIEKYSDNKEGEIDISKIKNKLILQFLVSSVVDFLIATVLFFFLLKKDNTNKQIFNEPTNLISFHKDDQIIQDNNIIKNEINNID
jgi:hypothetical protein